MNLSKYAVGPSVRHPEYLRGQHWPRYAITLSPRSVTFDSVRGFLDFSICGNSFNTGLVGGKKRVGQTAVSAHSLSWRLLEGTQEVQQVLLLLRG